ncbi:ATPase [Rhizocola hellebori]|uniref:ATPase n=1 Tax=Rhizocola hellebori TaxID=1392758 RepID=A0A8J3QBC5_9ACTN|nr:DUF87 domain-containing protein [Rhizocola hellebori]GIH06814.1 ATPase [Rhizocola hellebori]
MEWTQPITFEWANVPDDVWNSSPLHVTGLHSEVVQRILAGVKTAGASADRSPLGVAVQGQRGSGKTHMLGWVREQVQQDGGYFFLVGLLDGTSFWESTMISILDGLLRESNERESQLKTFLRRLSAKIGLSGAVQGAIAGDLKLTPDDMAAFIANLRHHNRQVGMACQDTARAVVLYASADQALQDIGYNYLQSMDDTDANERAIWGLHRSGKPPQQVLKELSQLLALTGPAVIAIDQIDTLLAQSLDKTIGTTDGLPDPHEVLLLDRVADGLMRLRETTRRTVTVLTSLPESWVLIKSRAIDTVPDRFHEARALQTIPTAEFGRELIEKRLAAQYRDIGFVPAYPTWPVKPEAFAEATDFTPRGLMKAVAAHIDRCFQHNRMTELEHLIDGKQPPPLAAPTPPEAPADALKALDRRFAGLCKIVDVGPALDPATEDGVLPSLLSAGLAAFIEEIKSADRVLFQDPPPGKKAPLHARLREDLDEATENETHWAFRGIASDNAVAALNRIRAASTTAGLHHQVPGRKLFLLRNKPWNKGPKTQQVLAEFAAAGGVTLPIAESDLKVFAALKDVLTERDPALNEWLVARRHASSTALFQAVFGDFLGTRGSAPPQVLPPSAKPRTPATPRGPVVALARFADGEQVLGLPLESLRKHTAIFAGSGSGKTVLIRRLVEECALNGVSAIVLDPNNDLARLGDPWPDAPSNWGPGDADKARDYIANTDVVVWTPRRTAGRPLSFKPLPDFRSVIDDADEFSVAIDAAVAALAPRAKVDSELAKASQGRAVLRATLQHFARRGGTSLKEFVKLLAELPDGLISLSRADKLASEMSDSLTAAMVNDPMFGGEGEPVDPGILLTPAPGKRARISVISFAGLPSDSQRQGFVNQLQMALFAWIRQNPAGDRPLGGLLVMDEAQTLAPSGAMTACTQSTLALASQARKYGLGLVFATQAPKALHNRIPGNAATQFFGFLNSPAQISAAREMAQAKGSQVLDISLLSSGQFYASGEGTAFSKIQMPMCLSHHPSSPLTTEEVIARAAGTGPADGTRAV